MPAFGLKGRFDQPRPKAWGSAVTHHRANLKGSFDRPFQGHDSAAHQSQAFGLG
jgi:hypothetical protein